MPGPTSGKKGDIILEEGIKEQIREICLAHSQTSAFSGHTHETGRYLIWNEVKFIDQDLHCHTRRLKDAIHIRIHPDNLNRGGGNEIPEAWMSTIKVTTNDKMLYYSNSLLKNENVDKK